MNAASGRSRILSAAAAVLVALTGATAAFSFSPQIDCEASNKAYAQQGIPCSCQNGQIICAQAPGKVPPISGAVSAKAMVAGALFESLLTSLFADDSASQQQVAAQPAGRRAAKGRRHCRRTGCGEQADAGCPGPGRLRPHDAVLQDPGLPRRHGLQDPFGHGPFVQDPGGWRRGPGRVRPKTLRHGRERPGRAPRRSGQPDAVLRRHHAPQGRPGAVQSRKRRAPGGFAQGPRSLSWATSRETKPRSPQ